MAAVNFLMANGAVLKYGRSQIVKRRRHDARDLDRRRRKVGMALQTDEADVGADQHPGISRAMRFVTGLAAFKAHRRMFERKWTPFVTVAAKTARLVGGEGLLHGGPDAAMRIVAIHTAHGAFREFVMKRPLKQGPLI